MEINKTENAFAKGGQRRMQPAEMPSSTPRPRRRRRRKVTTRFYRLLVLCFVVIVASSYGIAIWRVKRVDGQIETARRSLAAIRARNAQLIEELERTTSDEYIESIAREDLGLVAEGETAFVIVKPEEEAHPLDVKPRPGATRIEGW